MILGRFALGVLLALSAVASRAETSDPVDATAIHAVPPEVTLRFPLPDEAFEGELERLADVFAAKLRFPDHVACGDALANEWHVRRILEAIASWPHPAFREPLRELLHEPSGNAVLRFHAGAALLRYADPGLRNEVEGKRSSGYTERGCLAITHDVADLLQERIRIDGRFEEHEALYPLGEDASRVLPRELDESVVLPTAVAGLRSESLSVRLQSWIWLAQRGLYAPTEPVTSAWSRLDGKRRLRLVGVSWMQTSYIGRERFGNLLEALLVADGSRDIELALLTYLVSFGGERARAHAREIVYASARGVAPSFEVFDWASRRFELALQLLASGDPEPRDLPLFLALTASPSPVVRREAWVGVERSGSPVAFAMLREPLVEGETRELVGVVRALGSESARDDEDARWRRLELIAAALAERVPERTLFPVLVESFERLAGVDLGFSSRRAVPPIYNEAATRAAATRCLVWFHGNRPRGR